jgi:hypothetical protein
LLYGLTFVPLIIKTVFCDHPRILAAVFPVESGDFFVYLPFPVVAAADGG